ncbi:MAG TPA: periplasmic heavy metal sensor [Blastocatellia bacterium]|nr:periplasmic heavy metal sensor [Blastocatellia bacterium]
MIKKLVIAPILLTIFSGLAATSATAQVRPRANRILKEQRLEGAGDPQVGQRFPRGNRPPLNNPQANRQPGPNQVRKQRLQQLLMQRLDLRPEQRMRMQEIRRSHDDEVISSGRRMRQARVALDRAIMSENYNEEAVRRATEELAAAQADKIRIEARIRAQVRGVLTNEQVIEFNRLQREMRREMQQQRREMQQERMGEPLNPPVRPPLEDDEIDLLALLAFEN